jgi:transposase
MKSDHSFGRSYSIKGQTPVLKKSGSRFSCNVISMLSNVGIMRFMTFKDNFTKKTFQHFLSRMLVGAKRKIFLIVDNHRAHHAKTVRKWLAKMRHRIEVHYLPPYCPEMNPTELLNQDLKANAFKHKIIRSQDELEIATRVYLGNIQFDEFKVRSFFTPKPVEYVNQTYSSNCMAG